MSAWMDLYDKVMEVCGEDTPWRLANGSNLNCGMVIPSDGDDAFRFLLWRVWDTREAKPLFVVGSQASTATHEELDPTTLAWAGRAAVRRAGGFIIWNLHPTRSEGNTFPAAPQLETNLALLRKLAATGAISKAVLSYGTATAVKGENRRRRNQYIESVLVELENRCIKLHSTGMESALYPQYLSNRPEHVLEDLKAFELYDPTEWRDRWRGDL